MNPKDAIAAIRSTTKALTKAGVNHWLDCGSLLGAVREGGVMAHDLDVDFSSDEPEKHNEVHNAMTGAGFRPFRTHGTPELGFEQRFVHKSGVRVDVFYFYPGTVRNGKPVDDPKLCWQGSWDHDKLLVSEFRADIVRETIPFRFQGITVPVPVDHEGMLEARYGDWRTPVTKWDWRTDPKCIVEDKPMGDATFLIKTFLRYNLARRAVESIRNFHGDVPIVLVDDSDAPQAFVREMEKRGVNLIRLPYDSGLSAGRNAGIQAVETERVLILDDDMIVTKDSRLDQLLKLLAHCDVACGSMRQNNRIIDWQGTYAFPKGGLKLVPFNKRYTVKSGVKCGEVDFGLNVLASTPEFLKAHPWDPSLKIMEHTSFFLGLKEAGAKVLFAPDCIVDHKPERTTTYRQFRRRKEFRLRFFDKHGFKFHIGYSGTRDDWKPQDVEALAALKAQEV